MSSLTSTHSTEADASAKSRFAPVVSEAGTSVTDTTRPPAVTSDPAGPTPGESAPTEPAPTEPTPGDQPRVGVVVASTRPVRIGRQIADAVVELAVSSGVPIAPRILDLRDIDLPFLDEPTPPSTGQRTLTHSQAWSQTIGALDGIVFVTAEYNGGYPAPLKNAIDFLKDEWADLPGAIVSYGGAGGVSSAAQLRTVLTQLRVDLADVDPALRVRSRHYGEDRTLVDAAEVVAGSTAALLTAWGWVAQRAGARAAAR